MRTLPLVIAAALGCAAPAVAQDSTAAPPAARQATTIPHKSATTATLVSLIAPGVGHMYTGETGKGLVLFGIGAASEVAGIAVLVNAVNSDVNECILDNCTLNHTAHSVGWAYGLVAIGVGAYIYGIADAGSSAHRVNERNARKAGLTLLGADLEPMAAPTPQGFAVGMRVALRH